MARTLTLTAPPLLLQKVRGQFPFWLGLLFSCWLLAASAQDPSLGLAGVVPLLPALLMIGLAFTLLALRSREPAACLLAVYLTTLAVLASGNVAGLPPLAPPAGTEYVGGYGLAHIVWAFALGGVPLYFGWVYTEPDRIGTPFRFRALATASLFVCIALGEAACVLLALHGAQEAIPLENITRHLPSPYHRLLIYASPMLLAQHAAAFWLLLRHYRRWGEARNRALVMVFGIALLFVACVIINDSVARLETNALANLTACLVPLMVVYALEKHALFDVRIFIRRAVQYAFARNALTLMALAPVVALAYLVGLWQNSAPILSGPFQLLRETMRVSGPFLCIVLSLTFAFLLAIRAPLLARFDRAYFREIYDAQRVLGQVGRSLLGAGEPREIARATLEGIDSVLHPQNAIALAEENGRVFCLAWRNYTGYRPPLWPDPALMMIDRICDVPDLSAQRTGSTVYWTDALPSAARALLAEANIRLIIPLREEDRTTGLLLLGERASGTAYSPEDVEILRALASQVALAMQSARLNREFLRRSARELKAGSVGFVELVERERRLLAADLHDQTLPELRCLLSDLQSLADAGETPALTTLELSLSPAAPDRMTLDEMAEHLRQTIENIRDIMESLRPSALEMLGLLPALENELRKATARARPPLVPQFQVQENILPENLSSFAEMSIFRIAQEAVNNACRHARARHVRVRILVEEDEWILRVEDDGAGLMAKKTAGEEEWEAEKGRQGRGLDNMRYRANLIGARLTWKPGEGNQGTCVELRLPLNVAAA